VRRKIDEPQKWIKEYNHQNGACCLLGAIDRTHMNYEQREFLIKIIAEKIASKYPDRVLAYVSNGFVIESGHIRTNMHSVLTRFNDKGVTQHKDVLGIVDMVIQDLSKTPSVE
jgi:hypothetical protein